MPPLVPATTKILWIKERALELRPCNIYLHPDGKNFVSRLVALVAEAVPAAVQDHVTPPVLTVG